MRTLTALYDTHEDAERARDQLQSVGVEHHDIQIGRASETSGGSGGEQKGFFEGLKDFFMPEEDRQTFSEGVSRGGCMLTARVRDDNTDEAIRVLEGSGAIDLDQREQEWRAAGWMGSGSGMTSADTPRMDTNGETSMSHQTPGVSGQAERFDTLQAGEEARIPITEEQLRVGKREIDRGGVRVRSYVVETPVHEQIGLREEHVEIERRPVNETVRSGAADGLFEERTFEVSEHAEEAVVDKQAIVREELTVRKDVEEHIEDIEDTVRHTEVDVQDERSSNRTFGADDLSRRRDI